MSTSGINTSYTCFGTNGLGKLCIESYDMQGFTVVCTATLNGQQCNECVFFPDGICFDKSSLQSQGGYKLDCSNAGYPCSNMHLCGHQINCIGTPPPPRKKSNDHDLSYAFFLFFIIFVVMRNVLGDHRRQGTSYQPVDLGGDVEIPTIARATEILQDDATSFAAYDASLEDERSQQLRAFYVAGDRKQIRTAFSTWYEEGNVQVRSFYLDVLVKTVSEAWPGDLAKDTICSAVLDAWVSEEPDCYHGRLARGETLLYWAWHARTACLGRSVSEEQGRYFFARLELAATDISRAKELNPRDALVHASTVTLAKGILPDVRLSESVQDSLLSVARSNDKLNYSTHVRALSYYCKKWAGSHEKMFRYARSVVHQLPNGHPLWVLIPMAHYERQLIERLPNYWQESLVQQDILGAYAKALGGNAISLNPLAWEQELEWTTRNYFAYCLLRIGCLEQARHQIRIIGRRPLVPHPWLTMARYRTLIQALDFCIDEEV